jgi:hypothetical protein
MYSYGNRRWFDAAQLTAEPHRDGRKGRRQNANEELEMTAPANKGERYSARERRRQTIKTDRLSSRNLQA